MIVQFVQFKTPLSDDEVRATARERLSQFEALPNLLQKYYLKLNNPGHYGGLYIWDKMQSLQEFRGSELARSIPQSYRIEGTPVVDIHQVIFPLRAQAHSTAK